MRIDEAIDYWPRINDFLRQDTYEPVSLERSYQELHALLAEPARPA